MRKKRPHYAPEFRRQMVELVRAGRSPAELENEFEPTAQTIRKWVAQGDRDEGRRLGTAQRHSGRGVLCTSSISD
jgi:transposase